MNVQEALDYLKAGLLKAGYKPHQVMLSQDLAGPNNHDSVPSASVYALESRLTRQMGKVRIPLSELADAPAGAVGGIRQKLMGGLTWFEVTLTQPSMPAMQNALAALLEYLARTPLIDRAGNSYDVLTEGNERERELTVVWNDHDQQDRVTCTFQLPLPGIVWRDHPLMPIEIVVEYRLGGGNPDE